MLNRKPDKSVAAINALENELGNQVDVSFVLTDLAVLDSVRAAAAERLNKVTRIDALLCDGFCRLERL